MNNVCNYKIRLPADWVTGDVWERALRNAGSPCAEGINSVAFVFPSGCKIMVDAGVRVLSLVNQLAHLGRQVVLYFEAGWDGVMGYFDRLGFFDLLHPAIKTIPARPPESGAAFFGGSNPGVVEFLRICPSQRDRIIPSQLTSALVNACQNRRDCSTLEIAAYTLFAELIGNIYDHSATEIDGYAALQMYRRGGKVIVVVSDSGAGMLETLRPALSGTSLADASDADLIVHMLNHGISRFGSGRGCGLQQCARHALKYGAELTLRLPTSSLRLVPSANGYEATGFATSGLPLLKGTHVAFKFRLDNQ